MFRWQQNEIRFNGNQPCQWKFPFLKSSIAGSFLSPSEAKYRFPGQLVVRTPIGCCVHGQATKCIWQDWVTQWATGPIRFKIESIRRSKWKVRVRLTTPPLINNSNSIQTVLFLDAIPCRDEPFQKELHKGVQVST